MLFIVTEYFYPFLDGGGPIRSIESIFSILNNNPSINLITSANNHQSESLPNSIKNDQFVTEPVTNVSTYYSSNSIFGFFKIFRFYYENRKNTFYINGMFIPRLSLLPALICKNIIICPRGMLISETLGSKSFLKKIYLIIYKLVVSNNAIWHATDTTEGLDIIRFFGPNVNVKLISNIPLKPLVINPLRRKSTDALKIVYYSLIVEKKGLLILIQSLKSIGIPVVLDIYGSIKDKSYWKKCLIEIKNNNSQVSFNYLGHANPSESQTILANYDAFVLLTKGENFGHSIYEALSVGTPVIITNKTPWKFDNSANPPGWIVNYDNYGFDIDALKQVITNLYHLDSDAYTLSSIAAHTYSVDFYNSQDFKKKYINLFNSFDEKA
jgi:glycosyltransferase involved in cell wall biosynthesis